MTTPPADKISNRRLSFGGHQYEWGQLYIEPRDWWIGVYVAPDAVYVCPLPCLVLKIWRRA